MQCWQMVCPLLFLLFMTSHITHNLQAHPLTEKGKNISTKNRSQKSRKKIRNKYFYVFPTEQGTYLKRAELIRLRRKQEYI